MPRDVEHMPASLAYEVAVLAEIVVVTGGTPKAADIRKLACLGHLAQVPVYRRLADGGMLFCDKPVHLLGCGVHIELPHGVEDQATLDCVAFFGHFI
jgi:hypothetical protein